MRPPAIDSMNNYDAMWSVKHAYAMSLPFQALYGMEKLTGQQLLSKLAEMEGASKSDQARAAGYIRILDDGTEKADFSGLFSAVLEAKEQTSVSKQIDLGEQREEVADVTSLEYWSSLDDDQIETHLCYMNAAPPVLIIPKLASSFNPSIRESVAELLETPEEIIVELLNDEEQAVREAACLSRARFLMAKQLPKHEFLSLLASDKIDDVIAKKVFDLGSEELQGRLAGNANISEACLEELLTTRPADWIETILMQNIARRRLPQSFAGLDEVEVISRVSRELPEQPVLESLVALFLDSCENKNSLCFYLANNAATPPYIFDLLARKCDFLIKLQLASNTAIPLHVLGQLASDPETKVRQAVAKNKLTPTEILERLSSDHNDSVRSSAKLRLLPLEWQRLEDDDLRKKLQMVRIDDEILRTFIADGETELLLNICRNPYLSESIQMALASDSDPSVVLELLSNPVTSDSVIAHILKDWEFYEPIKASILKRQLPSEISSLSEEELVDYVKTNKLSTSLLAYMFSAFSMRVRQAIIHSNLLCDETKQSLIDQYNRGIYSVDSLDSLIFRDHDEKGWIIIAVSTYVVDNEIELIASNARECVIEDARRLLSVASTIGPYSPSFVREGSPSCSKLFFVVEPFGNCLTSLVNRDEINADESRAAQLFTNVDEALASADPVHAQRVFSCLAFTYSEFEVNIVLDDLCCEESPDNGEYYENFPAMSKHFEDGLEVYFKPHPAHGDPEFVTRLSWEGGELEEEEKLPNKMSLQLQELRVGNPFEIYYS